LGNRSILIVDQAENLSPGNIRQLAALAELCGERGKLLTIILAAQPLVRALLDRPEFVWIRQQLFGERTLSTLTPKETGEYIRHRLHIAGAVDTRLFDDRAISLIHEISAGKPRLINRVCHAAMLVAYAAQTPRISRTIVEEATSHPAVRERTIAARDLGPAMIGVGGAGWLSIPESLDRMASSDESQMTPDPNEPSPQRSRALGLPFESSVTPADILNYDEADDTGSDENVISGASIVDGEYEGFNGEFFASVPNKGTFLLARLERAMARAERMTSTTDASLTRLAAVQQHLATLVDLAQRLTKELRVTGEDTTIRLAKLTAETQRATQTLYEWVEEAVQTQSRLERTLSECPPTRQTHPTEAVRRLSRAVEPFTRITAEDAGGELQILSEPDFDTTPVEPRAAQSTTRAEEISRLISEAKRQETPAPA